MGNSGTEYKIGDIFYVTSGVRITTKNIYDRPGNMPCVTSQTTNEGIAWYGDEKWLNNIIKNGNKVVVERPCITWTKDGVKSGTMFVRNSIFYPNDHCGVLIPKGIIDINLNWFVSFYQDYIYTKVNAQKSQGMLYEEQMKNIKVRIPDITTQDTMYEEYRKKITLKELLDDEILKINNLLSRAIDLEGDSTLIGEVFEFKGGNQGLTEELIYRSSTINGEEKLDVLSSATNNSNSMGEISINTLINNVSIKIYEGPCIVVARNGYAGSMSYIREKRFTINDHAYVMYEKKQWRGKVNLLWFSYYYQQLFYAMVTSKSDNANFSKEYIKQQKVIIPDISIQNRIAEKYVKLQKVLDTLEVLDKKLIKAV